MNNGIEVHALHLRGALGFVRCLFKLIALLRRIKPSIVQTWMVHSDLLGGVAARLAGVPRVIWGVRTTDYSIESRLTCIVRWLCARLSTWIPDKIVCAAHASLASSLIAGYDANKLITISNGFDIDRLRANIGAGASIRKELCIDDCHILIGCLGRFNLAKDHANFIRAAGLTADRYSECRFLMVGRDVSVDNGELMQLIEASGYSNRFILLGERSDPAACLDAMDIFVLSSCTEGFPNVLGEAMAMGVPCVTTDVGDAAVLLGDAGEVVPARAPTALADAISRLLDFPATKRQALGRAGMDRVKYEFSINAVAQKFSDLYTILLVNNGSVKR
jgi:glycosyltransferase involved in cell wall biosynthesis